MHIPLIFGRSGLFEFDGCAEELLELNDARLDPSVDANAPEIELENSDVLVPPLIRLVTESVIEQALLDEEFDELEVLGLLGTLDVAFVS